MNTTEPKTNLQSAQLALKNASLKINETLQPQQSSRWQTNFYRLGSIALLMLIGWASYRLLNFFSDTMSVLGYSLFISYLLIGLVDWLNEKTIFKNRTAAVLAVYALIGAVMLVFALIIVPDLVRQSNELIGSLPDFIEQLDYNIETIGRQYFGMLPFDWSSITNLIRSGLQQLGPNLLGQTYQIATGTLNFAVYGFVAVVLSAYFLIDGPRIWRGILKPFSPKYAAHAEVLRQDLHLCLRAYLLGQAQLSALSGLVVLIIYICMGCPYALLLGICHGLIEIIPVIGGFIGIFIGAVVLLLTVPNPWLALIAVGIYFFYTQVVKDNFLAPRIMGNAIGLHPVMILIVVLIGAKAGGVSGVVFSLPVAGLVNVTFNYFLKLRTGQMQTKASADELTTR